MALASNITVTDILVRGGGGTVTFSDNVTIEFVYTFGDGVFGVTLVGDRASRVYDNIVSEYLGDLVDWIVSGSNLEIRLSDAEVVLERLLAYRTVTSDTTITATDRVLIVKNDANLDLPDVTTVDGFDFIIKNRGSSVVTITPNGSNTVDGSNDVIIIDADTSFTLISNGVEWSFI